MAAKSYEITTRDGLRYAGDKWVDQNYGYDGSSDPTNLEDAIAVINKEVKTFVIECSTGNYRPDTEFFIDHWCDKEEVMLRDYSCKFPFLEL